jgi:hypothetical protein
MLKGKRAAIKYDLQITKETIRLRGYICSNMLLSRLYRIILGSENAHTKERVRKYDSALSCLSAVYQ